jgi:hypothetical protein
VKVIRVSANLPNTPEGRVVRNQNTKIVVNYLLFLLLLRKSEPEKNYISLFLGTLAHL